MKDADRIRKIRDQLNLTQAELAKLLHVSTETVCRWEKGKRVPQPGHMERLEALAR